MPLNAQVDASGQGATARLWATGIYRDRLHRRDGRWLFAERHVTVDH